MISLHQLFQSLRTRFKYTLRKQDHSLSLLNFAQFTIVLIDNIFKLAIAFFLIDRMGKQHASQVLALVGIVYVVPFLLFSSTGGTLADRFSKQRIIIAMKVFEALLILASLVSFHYHSVFGAYTILFLLSVESAIFGPAKYGIIVELVPKEFVTKANGIITSCTYLAIILGTFLGSFFTEIFHKNYVLLAWVVLLISILGLLSAFAIRYTPPSGSQKKVHPFFIHELLETLTYAKTKHQLVVAILASSYFLFIGAFTQLTIIPYAIQAMHLSEVSGGYLFLSTAMGIAIGSFIYGKTSKNRINLLTPALLCSIMGCLLMLLKFSPFSLVFTISVLVSLGIVGGMYIVPFDTFIQISSGDEKRGQVIGLSNFTQFVGVLMASISLFVFTELGLPTNTGFLLVGALTLVFSSFLCIKLSDWGLPFISKRLWYPLHTTVYDGQELLEHPEDTILITTEKSLKTLSLLSRNFEQVVFITPKNFFRIPSFLQKILGCLVLVEKKTSIQDRIEIAKGLLKEHTLCCVVMEDHFSLHEIQKKKGLMDFFKEHKPRILYADISSLSPRKSKIELSKIV